MDCILVGVDGSAVAHDALVWSSDLARRLQLELVVACVVSSGQAELGLDAETALHDEQRAELDRWCNSLPEGIPSLRAMLLDGGPADVLLRTAGEVGADMLVVGGRGTRGPSHVHVGSVAQSLVQYTTIPLAIVSNGDATPVQRIVLGVDGSDATDAAVAFVAEVASGLGVGVTAVHAFERFTESVPDSNPRSAHHEAEVVLRHWVEAIERAGVEVELDADRDIDPVPAISRALDAHPHSVGVVGTHGLSPVSGMRLGRLPLRLVHHTGMPVIVVPNRTVSDEE